MTGSVVPPVLSRTPSRALYIKLGPGGRWESSCILADQTIRLGYGQVPTSECVEAAATGDWSQIEMRLLESGTKTIGAARSHVRQIHEFFTAEDDVLWITFFQRSLWWCFAETTVRPAVDGHVRKVIGKWSSTDLKGGSLYLSTLSGRLSAIQSFRGTICAVPNLGYLVSRLRGDKPDDVRSALNALDTLANGLQALIARLHWRDFEILVDLIFRAAGLQRVNELGGTMRSIDLDLVSPLTGERYAAQVKSQAGPNELADIQAAFADRDDFTRIYLVVHSPDTALKNTVTEPPFELLGPRQLAELTIRNGLTDWLLRKAS